MVDFGSAFHPDDESVIFSCGLLLPPDQEHFAIELSKGIAEHNPDNLKFILNKVTHPPYIRVYETVMPAKNIQTAITRLEKITSSMSPFHMKWGMIEQTNHFIAVWGELNETLKVFHEKVLTEVNELREGFFKEKYIEDENEHIFSEAEEESFRKWGSPWADPYVPHMIIAKAKPIFDVKSPKLEWNFKSCLFRGLLIGVRDEYGEFSHSFQTDFVQSDYFKDEAPEVSELSVISLK